jgi:hypothetical protein
MTEQTITPPENLLTLLELVMIVGDVLTEIDVLSTYFNPGTDNRTKLDAERDKLDAGQRKLVKGAIKDNTEEFKKRTASIKTINKVIQQTINDVDKFATTLETVVKFVGAIQKIAELAP